MERNKEGLNGFSISIIIPVLDEAGIINSAIHNVRSQAFDGICEIIIVDGDPAGSTLDAVETDRVVRTTAPVGRARQMNAGAAVAKGRTLVFLHADTRLPPDALAKIAMVLENNRYVGGAFDLAIDSDRLFLRYIARRACFRSRLNRIPYGDRAIFIRKCYFQRIGGYREIPLMEDVDLMRRIKKDRRKIYILPDRVMTSARRWEAEGLLYTTIKNQVLVSLYYLGVSPHKLAKFYRRHC